MRLFGLDVVLRVGHEDVIDQHARHLDLLGVQRAGARHVFHLGDHDATAGTRRLRDGERVRQHAFARQGNVAVLVRRGAADQRHVHPGRLEVEELFAIQLAHLHQVFLGAAVDLAAFQARVDEGPQAHLGEHAAAPAGHVARHHGQHALWPVVGLDLLVAHQFGQARAAHAVMGRHHAPGHAFVREMGHALVLEVALADRGVEGQVARVAGGQKGLLHLQQRLFGQAGHHHAGGVEGVAVADESRGFFRGDELDHL